MKTLEGKRRRGTHFLVKRAMSHTYILHAMLYLSFSVFAVSLLDMC